MMGEGRAVRFLIIMGLACSVVSCGPSDEGTNKQASGSGVVGGLSCRLYVPAYDPDKSKDYYELTFEVTNVGNSAVALPVIDGYGPVPYVRISIQEEPDVMSPSKFGFRVPAIYVLRPGDAFRFRVRDGYFLGYGTHTADGWVRFKPSEGPYHLTATMETRSRPADVQRVFLPGENGRFHFFSRVERLVERENVARMDRYWVKWTGDRAVRWCVPLPSAGRGPEDTVKEERVPVTISETMLRIEDPSVSTAYGEGIECWSGKLVSNSVEVRLD